MKAKMNRLALLVVVFSGTAQGQGASIVMLEGVATAHCKTHGVGKAPKGEVRLLVHVRDVGGHDLPGVNVGACEAESISNGQVFPPTDIPSEQARTGADGTAEMALQAERAFGIRLCGASQGA